MNLNKLSLGTANFVKAYGVKNRKGLSNVKIKKIFKILKKNKLRNIDTAFSYKGVEKKLGNQNLGSFYIYTKVPKMPKKCKNIKKWFNKIINKSLIDLNIKKFECVYLHCPEDLLKKNGNILYKNLLNLKKKKIVKKIGISIYNYSVLNKILNKYKFDAVQISLNIFDRRLIVNRYLEKLKKKNIEIHVRSIFLQGILLTNFKKIPNYFKKWNKIFLLWEQWCKFKNISKLQCCLNFILNYKNIDKIIIGVQNQKQLIQIIKCLGQVSKKYPDKIFSNNSKLIDPRKWKKI